MRTTEYPITIIEYTGISCSQVDTQTTCPCAENKYPIITVNVIELLDLFAQKKVIKHSWLINRSNKETDTATYSMKHIHKEDQNKNDYKLMCFVRDACGNFVLNNDQNTQVNQFLFIQCAFALMWFEF